jgi:hypothetical protein
MHAVQRLNRIAEAKHQKLLTNAALESCVKEKFAAFDPVLLCAMHQKTDEDAAVCIEKGIKDVMGPNAGSSGGGRGLNPLLGD